MAAISGEPARRSKSRGSPAFQSQPVHESRQLLQLALRFHMGRQVVHRIAEEGRCEDKGRQQTPFADIAEAEGVVMLVGQIFSDLQAAEHGVQHLVFRHGRPFGPKMAAVHDLQVLNAFRFGNILLQSHIQQQHAGSYLMGHLVDMALSGGDFQRGGLAAHALRFIFPAVDGVVGGK